MQFRKLNVGDTFDWIGPDHTLNSYYHRCRKISARSYVSMEGNDEGKVMVVGRVTVKVYHVNQNRFETI